MIHLLPQDLINKIAAGEVVERPASVVKELTENAVDAGASRLEITIEQGGTQLIQISDNGQGMNADDAKLCLLRHATSKLNTADDLFALHTLGFRGEALASIAAVSQFDLITKQADELEATKVWLDTQHQVQSEAAAANAGTTVSVRNIFYNVPARQKFLKTANTEFTHILRYLQQFALVHPELEIKMNHNGKTTFHYQASSWSERVEQVLGKTFSSKLIPIDHQQEGITVTGFVAKPELVHASHKNQYLFVNDRPVYDHLVARSVLEAYDTMVPRGYFPAFVIKLQIDPAQVDVNVHPRKSEVKFLQPSQIIQAIKGSVRQSLSANDLTAEQALPVTSSKSFLQFREPSPSPAAPKSSPTYSPSERRPSSGQVKQVLEFSQSFSSGIQTIKQTPLTERGWTVIGQIHLSFILVETPEGLQLCDQHALSEITNYHRLMKQRESGEVTSQQLLLPLEAEVTAEEKSIVEENIALFQRLGWEIDELSHTSYQISALPEILKQERMDENFHEIIDLLKEEKKADMTTRELALIKYEACRGAVMFGDAMTMEEMKGLLNQWLEVPNNAACEHGRPAAARISVEEMRKFFKR